MSLAWLRPSWLFNRRIGKVLLWTVLLLTAAVTANALGIHFVGSVASWERWLADAAVYFVVWRLCLYGATVYGWLWMRRRLLARENNAEAQRRLLRAEVASIIAIVALEASLLMQAA
ncbi:MULTISPECIES: hypothetical protein [unclassified Brenneria]|uniref:hypothetical protein n=1 Tax=unclassified Brenneria TaxID=2634434 RepID=UPI0018F0B469|nr:hypothetical protein [Brenneria sp. L3-3C-1]MBJ7223549.1 hypothetical protein [Brenneria sp. L3-3C-1]MEE3644791.1 hypothetical protein [Brenneria sp. L3_3C_1]